jgi:hypothetical protein
LGKIDMKYYGLSERFITESKLYDLSIGRIVSQDKGSYRLVTENGRISTNNKNHEFVVFIHSSRPCTFLPP